MPNDNDLIRRGDALSACRDAMTLDGSLQRIAALPAVTVGVICTWPSCGHTAKWQCNPSAHLAALEPVTPAPDAYCWPCHYAGSCAKHPPAPDADDIYPYDAIEQCERDLDGVDAEAAPDAAAIREAVADLADFLDAQHKSHMTGLGRNPADYMSGYSIARDMARDILITEKPHDRAALAALREGGDA